MKANTLVISALIIMGLSMSGCGTIRSHRNLEQTMGSVLTTGIGGTVFRLNKTGDLPNAFGGRDIWGGKIDKGRSLSHVPMNFHNAGGRGRRGDGADLGFAKKIEARRTGPRYD